MNKKNLVYAVRDANILLDDGYGKKILSNSQIEYYGDPLYCGIHIGEQQIFKGLGGSIHYLYHFLMHPKLFGTFHGSEWAWIPIEEDKNAHIIQRVYTGKIAGCFYHINPKEHYHPLAIILSDTVPEHILYIVSGIDERSTSEFLWNKMGLSYLEWCDSVPVGDLFKHPFEV